MTRKQGFTLLELIITLLLIAVLAAAVAPSMGPSLYGGSEPLDWLEDGLALSQVMANIVAEYESGTKDEDYLYGTGGSSLQDQIGAAGSSQNNSFGKYNVEVNSKQKVDSSDPMNSLLVTISNDRGQTLTHLFTVRVN